MQSILGKKVSYWDAWHWPLPKQLWNYTRAYWTGPLFSLNAMRVNDPLVHNHVNVLMLTRIIDQERGTIVTPARFHAHVAFEASAGTFPVAVPIAVNFSIIKLKV